MRYSPGWLRSDAALGLLAVIFVIVVVITSDTAGFLTGRLMGGPKLWPRLSPNKTWEGAIVGFIFSVVTMIAAKILFLEYMALDHAVVIGMMIGCFGQIGDLVESRFKRDAGVKDSSSIIPGHGGVFDRFDSLVFVSPIVYLYIDFIVLS